MFIDIKANIYRSSIGESTTQNIKLNPAAISYIDMTNYPNKLQICLIGESLLIKITDKESMDKILNI